MFALEMKIISMQLVEMVTTSGVCEALKGPLARNTALTSHDDFLS